MGAGAEVQAAVTAVRDGRDAVGARADAGPPGQRAAPLIARVPVGAAPAAGGVPAPVVLAALRDLLERAEEGELVLAAVAGTGLVAVVERDGVRCTLVVELPDAGRVLSPRELQIARMVADGATNRAIAGCLDISLWTVSTHLRRIFAKLAVSSRAEMVAHLFGTPHLPAAG